MKKRAKTYLVVGLALLGTVLLVYGSMALADVVTTGPPGPSLAGLGYVKDNLVQEHSNDADASANITNQECLSCHDNILVQSSPASDGTLSAHKRHVMTVFLNYASNFQAFPGGQGQEASYGCQKCHQHTYLGYEGDLSYADPWSKELPHAQDHLRKQVDPQECLTCHGVFRTNGKGKAGSDYAKGEFILEHFGSYIAHTKLNGFHADGSTEFTVDSTADLKAGQEIAVGKYASLENLVIQEVIDATTFDTTFPSYFDHNDDERVEAFKTVAQTNPRGCTTQRKDPIIIGGNTFPPSTCHDPNLPGNDPNLDPSDGHTGIDWINQWYAEVGNYCLKCHGGAAWYTREETDPPMP